MISRVHVLITDQKKKEVTVQPNFLIYLINRHLSHVSEQNYHSN
jgi:hypothetical protein